MPKVTQIINGIVIHTCTKYVQILCWDDSQLTVETYLQPSTFYRYEDVEAVEVVEAACNVIPKKGTYAYKLWKELYT